MRAVTKHNVVRQRSFSERLADLMNRYRQQHLTSAQILAELVQMAKDVSADADRGKKFTPALSYAELAFYDAVADNDSALTELGRDKLADIARDLVIQVRKGVTVDWAARDDVRARLRSTIKRLLARHGYPPDAEQRAIDQVLEQTAHFAEDWSPETDR